MTVDRVVVLGWRVGLGWLLGRRRMLLTTTIEPGGLRRSWVPFTLGDGNLYAEGGGAWTTDIVRHPQAMAQAFPGPLAVRARPLDPREGAVLTGEGLVAFEPTGEIVPDPIEPDLALAATAVCVVATVVAGLVIAKRC